MNDDDSTPIMYDHCVAVFERMRAGATIRDTEGGVRIAVWEGFLTRLIQDDLELAVPYYSSIRAHLIRMGCVRQLRRGGGTSKSQWEVIQPPTRERFETAEATGNQRLQQKESAKQQLMDLTLRVAALESNERMLVDALNKLQEAFNSHVHVQEEVA